MRAVWRSVISLHAGGVALRRTARSRQLVLLLGEEVDSIDHVLDQHPLRVPDAPPVAYINAVNDFGMLAAGSTHLAVPCATPFVQRVEAHLLDQLWHEDVHAASHAGAQIRRA